MPASFKPGLGNPVPTDGQQGRYPVFVDVRRTGRDRVRCGPPAVVTVNGRTEGSVRVERPQVDEKQVLGLPRRQEYPVGQSSSPFLHAQYAINSGRCVPDHVVSNLILPVLEDVAQEAGAGHSNLDDLRRIQPA